MLDLLTDSVFWLNLFSVTLIQIALGADNLIIITILANKLPVGERKKAVYYGMLLAMVFRIILLFMVSYILKYATSVFYHLDMQFTAKFSIHGQLSGWTESAFFGGFDSDGGRNDRYLSGDGWFGGYFGLCDALFCFCHFRLYDGKPRL